MQIGHRPMALLMMIFSFLTLNNGRYGKSAALDARKETEELMEREWMYFDDEYDYVYFPQNSGTRDLASVTCLGYKGFMMELRSIEHYNAFKQIVTNVSVWSSLRRINNTWIWESDRQPLGDDPYPNFWACQDQVAVNSDEKILEYTNVDYAYFDYELNGMVDQGANFVGPSCMCMRKAKNRTGSTTGLITSSIMPSINFSTTQKKLSDVAIGSPVSASDWKAYGQTSMEYIAFDATKMWSYQEYQNYCRNLSATLPILLTNDSFQEFKTIIKDITFFAITRGSDGVSWYWDDDNKTKLTYSTDFFYCTPDTDTTMSSAVFNPKLDGGFAVDVVPTFSVNSTICIRDKKSTTSAPASTSTAITLGNTTMNETSTSFSAQSTLGYNTTNEKSASVFTQASQTLNDKSGVLTSCIDSSTPVAHGTIKSNGTDEPRTLSFVGNSTATAGCLYLPREGPARESVFQEPIKMQYWKGCSPILHFDWLLGDGPRARGTPRGSNEASSIAVSSTLTVSTHIEAVVSTVTPSNAETFASGFSNNPNSFYSSSIPIMSSTDHGDTIFMTNESAMTSSYEMVQTSTSLKTNSDSTGQPSRNPESAATSPVLTDLTSTANADTTTYTEAPSTSSDSRSMVGVTSSLKATDNLVTISTAQTTSIAGTTESNSLNLKSRESASTATITDTKSTSPAVDTDSYSQEPATTIKNPSTRKVGNYSRWVGKFKNVALEDSTRTKNMISTSAASSKRKCLEYCMKDASCSAVQISSYSSSPTTCQLLKPIGLNDFISSLKAVKNSDVYKLF